MKCCVCNSKWEKINKARKLKNLHFFQFPKDADQALKWTSILKIDDKEDLRKLRVCEKHFDENDLFLNKRKMFNKVGRLKPNAVPLPFQKESIGSNGPSNPGCSSNIDLAVLSNAEGAVNQNDQNIDLGSPTDHISQDSVEFKLEIDYLNDENSCALENRLDEDPLRDESNSDDTESEVETQNNTNHIHHENSSQDPRDPSPDPHTDSQRIAKRNHIRKLVEATERISFRRAMESSESSDSDSSPTRSYVRKLKIRRLREEVKNLQRTKNTYHRRIKRQSKKISKMRELLSDQTKKNSLMLLHAGKN